MYLFERASQILRQHSWKYSIQILKVIYLVYFASNLSCLTNRVHFRTSHFKRNFEKRLLQDNDLSDVGLQKLPYEEWLMTTVRDKIRQNLQVFGGLS